MSVRHLPYQIDPEHDRDAFYQNYWKEVSFELLARHLEPKGKTLLDYGCGRGEALQIAAGLGFVPTGTDTDPECVRLASKFGPARLLDVEDPVRQFGRKSFDAVCSFHVLEHVDSPKKTLNDLRLIARSFVLLAVPNLRQLLGLFQRRFDLADFNEGHLQSWDHWHLRNLAERHCGLQLVEWGSDITQLAFLSNVASKISQNFVKRLEMGLFRRWFPYHSRSIIGLFRVGESTREKTP